MTGMELQESGAKLMEEKYGKGKKWTRKAAKMMGN
jgi:hypothetical protein